MKSNEKAMYSNYVNAKYTDIWEAYNKPSYRKVKAWENIKEDMRRLNGHDLRITGCNSCTYTCAFRYDEADAVTGEVTDIRMRYYTAYNTYDFSTIA